MDNPGAFDHIWLNKTVNDFQKKLLKDYDTVVFVEADEILCHKTENLRQYIEEMKTSCIKATAYEIVQTSEEQEYNKDKFILEQRSKWFRHPIYDKTLISKVPCNWSLGFHGSTLDAYQDPNLILLHLHRLDKLAHLERKLNFQKLKYAEENPAWGSQNKLKSVEEINNFYDNHPPLENITLSKDII